MSDSLTPIETPAGGDPQALYRRFRAQTFAQIVGQDAVVQTLRNAVRLERLGHGLLFVGPRGTGKTSMARILAKAVNCTDLRDGEPCDVCDNCVAIREGRALDVVELDAASNNKVDDMRELVPRVYTAAADLRRKVFIIDEVQRIKEGWDVLLKTLEEPPDGVLFVFCTTDPSQIRPAVVSRLQRFTFRPLAVSEIEGKLGRILESEGRTVEPEAVALVSRLARGGMRDAESMLDQVLNSADDPITAATIQDLLGLADDEAIDRFIAALVGGDVLDGIAVLDQQEAEGRDLVAFAEQLVVRTRESLVRLLSSASADERLTARPLARAARRLTGIDSSRSGLGGYRWQLELCLLEAADSVEGDSAGTERPPARRLSVASAVAAAVSSGEVTSSDADISASAPATVAAPGAASAAPDPGDQPADHTPAPDSGDQLADHTPTPDLPEAAARPAGIATSDAGIATSDAGIATSDAGIATSDAGITEIRSAWPRIVAAVGSNPANRPLVTTCRPVEMRDGFLVLGFPEDQAFLRDIAERKRLVLEEGIASVMGRQVAVRCVVTNLELVEPVESGEDDLVAQARRIFDGELAPVQEVE